MHKILRYFLGSLLFLPWSLFALSYQLPEHGDLIGDLQYVDVQSGDNFNTIGHRYDVGYYELIEANPGVNADRPSTWSKIVIPTRKILPPGPRKGIVINLAEMRLYYYVPGTSEVMVFPVGIGREGWLSPLCATHIKAKEKYPTWNVPASIRADRAKEGVYLPKVVLPGPENPLGDYAMRLAVAGGTFLVHGTNDPDGIGRRSSSGCIRMLPEDIATLYNLVPVGTPVRIMNQPIKVGVHDGHVYLESHVPLQEIPSSSDSMMKLALAAGQKNHVNIEWSKAKDVAEAQRGIPESISGESSYVSNAPEALPSSHDIVIVSRNDVPKIIERDDVPVVIDTLDSTGHHSHVSSYDPASDNLLELLDES